MQSDDEAEVDALRRAHRAASARVDDGPDARARAAVLAAAARGIDARPRAVGDGGPATSRSGGAPFRSRRWPLSAAALLVVSVMTGLVATRVLHEGPERITTVASAPRQADRAAPGIAAEAPLPTPAPAGERQPAPPPAASRTDDRVAAARPRDAERASNRSRKADPAQSRPAPATESRRSAMRDAEPAAVPADVPAPTGQSVAATPAPRAKTEFAADAAPSNLAALTAARPAPASNAARTRIGRAAEPATPEAWVERIVRLRASGDDVEADREVEALHARYPDFAIPPAALGSTGTR